MPRITASRAGGSGGISIGELSRQTGVNNETIRYDEKIKMLQPPPRTEGSRRVDAATETHMLVFIRGAWFRSRRHPCPTRSLGAPGKALCADVRGIAAHHLDDIRSKIADLRKLEKLLANAIAQCSGKQGAGLSRLEDSGREAFLNR